MHHSKRLLTLDIIGAFANAWHPSILARLREQKCTSNIYNIILDLLQDRTAHITLGNTSISKSVTKGCPQGSVAGPTLWNVIVSALISQLAEIPNMHIVAYADDIMHMFRGTSYSQILSTLQLALQIMQDWCNKNKLEIAKGKSALMPMYAKKKEEYICHPTVKAWEFRVV